MTNSLVTSVPIAGKQLFGLGKHASYEAAKRGDIPTIRIGRRMFVPIRALEDMLGLPPGALKEVDLVPDSGRKVSA